MKTDINKYHDKITRFIYNKQEKNILSLYYPNVKNKQKLKIQLGDVVAIVYNVRPKWIVAYIHPDEFFDMLESEEIKEDER